jgi:hypothetical protein
MSLLESDVVAGRSLTLKKFEDIDAALSRFSGGKMHYNSAKVDFMRKAVKALTAEALDVLDLKKRVSDLVHKIKTAQ